MPSDRPDILPVPTDLRASWLLEAVLKRLLRRLGAGELVIETPAGARLVVGGREPGPRAVVRLTRWRALRRLLTRWDLGFSEGYMAGDWTTPDLGALLLLACRQDLVVEPSRALRAPRAWLRLRHALNRNTRRGSRRNIEAHYDLGNDFYARWLDAGMTYSSALYDAPGLTLEAAQDAKLDRVCALAELSGGERVLEIGCGWGGLMERLLARGAGRVTGLTLSPAQAAYAGARLAAEAAAGRASVRVEDYREVGGRFDRIVSIEMMEAVGEAYWPLYLATLRRALAPGGVAVLQVITIEERRFEHYRRRPDFIQRYVFPGGMLPTKAALGELAARAGFELEAVETFGASYARTLAEWRRRFEAAWPQVEALGFDERFRRMWSYYLTYCEAGFACGATDVGLYRLRAAG